MLDKGKDELDWFGSPVIVTLAVKSRRSPSLRAS